MVTAIYIRTSTTEQNPENQLKDCLFIYKSDFGNYEVFEDKQTAWKDNKERESFSLILNKIQSKKIDYLIVWDLDRIFRNRARLLGFMELCKVNSVTVLSYRQKFLNEIQEITLPKGFDFIKDMMINNFLQFLGWIAEDESTKKSERVKIAVRRDDGITKSYKGNKWGRKTLNDEVNNQIIELYKQGNSFRKICSEVSYWDKNRNKRFVSVGYVHKIISQLPKENPVVNEEILNRPI